MASKVTVVPHHRVDAALHKAAKKKAQASGLSLSQIAEAGLRAYTAAANTTVRSRAKEKVAKGKLTREAPTLPADTAAEIRKMVENKDVRLPSFLSALRSAGWSYAALAKPMGVSRQAVHLRLSTWAGDDPSDLPQLPPLPAGPCRTTFPAHASASNSAPRFDWAIWIDRNLYAVASEQARTANEAMRDVMEQILSDYVNGTLVVEVSSDSEGGK